MCETREQSVVNRKIVRMMCAICGLASVLIVFADIRAAFPSINEVSGIELVKELDLTLRRNPSFSPDGRFVSFMCWSDFKGMLVVDTTTWDTVCRIEAKSPKSIQAPIWISNDEVIGASADRPQPFSISTQRALTGNDASIVIDGLRGRRQVVWEYGREGLKVLEGDTVLVEWPRIGTLRGAILSPSGRYLAFEGCFPEDKLPLNAKNRQGMYLWDSENNNLVDIWGSTLGECAFSPDETMLLYSRLGYRITGLEDDEVYQGNLCLYDIAKAYQTELLPMKDGPIINLAWSSNGLICFTRDPSKLGFYRLKLAPPLGHTRSGIDE